MSKKILVINERLWILGLMIQIISSLGKESVGCSDTKKALDIFRENKEDVYLVIVDLDTNADVLELQKRIKEVRMGIRVFISCTPRESSQEIVSEFDGVVLKPFKQEEIRKLLSG